MTPDNEKIFIDPLKIDPCDMPMVVFESESNGFFSWAIRCVTKGLYNHSMWLTPEGFASQVFTYRMVPVKDYLSSGIKLKFFKILDLTPVERKLLYAIITKRLDLPWWIRRYDFLGIFGQLTGLRIIQNPWTNYCSEKVAADLKKATVANPPLRPTPEELEEFVKKSPRFQYVGHWIGD